MVSLMIRSPSLLLRIDRQMNKNLCIMDCFLVVALGPISAAVFAHEETDNCYLSRIRGGPSREALY